MKWEDGKDGEILHVLGKNNQSSHSSLAACGKIELKGVERGANELEAGRSSDKRSKSGDYIMTRPLTRTVLSPGRKQGSTEGFVAAFLRETESANRIVMVEGIVGHRAPDGGTGGMKLKPCQI